MDILEKYNINNSDEDLLKQYFIKIYFKERNDEKKEYRSNYYKNKRKNNDEYKLKCKENYYKYLDNRKTIVES
tara:strand:- start:1024 stop:1242 length:219 start_codon:yes stop_codon:yes gene_type:complete